MILDYQQELTTAGGQLFTAAAPYGTRPLDLLTTGIDPAIGDPLVCCWRVYGADSDVGTSQEIEIYDSTTGASGGSETEIATSGAITRANLTVAKGIRSFAIPKGSITREFLAVKVATVGTDPTAGKLKVWLQKGIDATPSNKADSF